MDVDERAEIADALRGAVLSSGSLCLGYLGAYWEHSWAGPFWLAGLAGLIWFVVHAVRLLAR